MKAGAPFITRVGLRPAAIDDYVLDIPAIRSLADTPIDLDPHVSFFVGDNGSGKSTLIEALAVASKLNPEGGGRLQMMSFSTRRSHSELHKALVVERAEVRPANAFFLRAESFFNFATFSEGLRMEQVYERELHEQSHGESFL